MDHLAIIAVPTIAMLFDRKIDVDPLVRWVLFALIALAAFCLLDFHK